MSPYDGAAAGCFVASRPAAERLARFLLTGGIAARLRPVTEEDVPDWLRRHEPDDLALAALTEDERYRGETDAAEVIDRVAGGWTYDGWKGGYFDADRDARAFYDEVRWLLWQGKSGPEVAQWRSRGLYWAYGLSAADEDSFVTDYRTGKVRRAEAGDLAPHGMFINGVHGALAAEGGGLDLWRREVRLAEAGAQSGANISDAIARGAGTFLAMGDAATGCALEAAEDGAVARRITIDSAHPESREVASRRAAAMGRAEFTETGRAIALRQIQSIRDACGDARDRRATDPRCNPTLRLALQSARQAMVPESAIRRALRLASQDRGSTAEDVFAAAHSSPAAHGAGDFTVTVIRVADSDLRDMSEDRTDGASSIVDTVAAAAWTAGNVGLDFAEAIDNWNGCPDAGEIRSASGDGSYVFLDDTAAECAVLNAAAFRRPDGSVDIDGFRHAARLMTLALDISLMSTALPSPRLARRVWDFRPLSLSVGGIGELLMACAIPYDSDEGRALCAGLCALLTGAASLASSEIADETGPCPASPDNATALRRLLAARRDVLRDRVEAAPMGMADAAQAIWQQALAAAEKGGLRNAYLTASCSAPREHAALDCVAPGVAPVPSLVRWEPTGTGGWRKATVSAVPAALQTLGYSKAETDAIVRHLVGHGTLAHAPGVNHETLRRRGFTDAAIATVEAALAYADDLSLVFNRWVLGDSFCRQMLGFTVDELADGSFDMLAALGFSDAGIEAATIYCFGAHAMEGAPHLKPEHLPVFDCAEPQGARGRRRVPPEDVVRMMAAAQPFVSGGIGHAVVMPSAATVDDCRQILRLAWRLGLKSLVLRGREADHPLPLHREDRTASVAGRAGLSLVASGGQRVDMRTESISNDGVPDSAGHAPTPSSDGRDPSGPIEDQASSETVIAAGPERAGGDAETSRGASSLAARSTASVPSSADAVVEQRQV